MAAVITNYTIYDMEYYYADLAHLPRSYDEECQQLLADAAHMPHVDTQTRNRLIEGHLSLATHIAIKRCPPSHYQSLPDIVGEVALTLINAVDRYDFQAGRDFPSYVVACTDSAIKRVIGNERLIRIPSSTMWNAKRQGTEQRLYELQPESLDAYMTYFDTGTPREPLAFPLLPTEEAPPRNPGLRAQVQAWLSYLSPQAQQVLTLRYGLADEDERCLTPAEIAEVLGLSRRAAYTIERTAKQSIRALVEGTATLVEKDGRRQVTGVHVFQPPTPTPEHEALLMEVALRLCQERKRVTCRLLAKESGKSYHLAQVFLRRHRDELPLVASAKHTGTRAERLAHVARVYADLVGQGQRISIKRLAKAAHVRKDLAAEFMHFHKDKEVGNAAA